MANVDEIGQLSKDIRALITAIYNGSLGGNGGNGGSSPYGNNTRTLDYLKGGYYGEGTPGYAGNLGSAGYNTKYDNFGNYRFNKMMNQIVKDREEFFEDMKRNSANPESLTQERLIQMWEESEKGKEAIQKLIKMNRQENTIPAILDSIGEIGKILMAAVKRDQAILSESIDVTNQIVSSKLDIMNTTIKDTLSLDTDLIFGDIRNMQYKAFEQQAQQNAQIFKLENSEANLSQKYQNTVDKENYKLIRETFDGVVNISEAWMKRNAMTSGMEKQFNEIYKEGNNGVTAEEALSSASSYAQSEVETNQFIIEAARQAGVISDNISDLIFGARDLFLKENEVLKGWLESVYAGMNSHMQEFVSIAHSNNDMMFELDDKVKKQARAYGYVGNQGQAYTSQFIKDNEMAASFGKTYEELLRMNQAYQDASNRSSRMSTDEMEQTLATSELFQVDEQQLGTIFGEMSVFNTSVKNANDMMFDMYKIANEMGVSNQKFAKDLSKNLKLAQTYNFVGGTEALMKMSLWSQQTRMNLETASGFAEKLAEGGVENTIETAAHLQVLGGNAAIYSDPLGMMYDSLADTEGIAKRLYNMVGNFGTFNSATGETEFSWTDTKMIRERAKAMGMTPEEAMNVVREKNKQKQVARTLFHSEFNEDEMSQIANRATYDRETGKWMVDMMDNTKRDITTLTKEDLAEIKPEKTDEALVEYSRRALSELQLSNAIQKEIAARMGIDTERLFYENSTITRGIEEEHGKSIRDDYASLYGQVNRQSRNDLRNRMEYSESFFDAGLDDLYFYAKDKDTKNSLAEVNRLKDDFLAYLGIMVNDSDLNGMAYGLRRFGEDTGNTVMVRNARNIETSAKAAYNRRNGVDQSWFADINGMLYQNLGVFGATSKARMNELGVPITAEYAGMAIDNGSSITGGFMARVGELTGKTAEVRGTLESLKHYLNNLTMSLHSLNSTMSSGVNQNINVSGNVNVGGNKNVDASEMLKAWSSDPQVLNQFRHIFGDSESAAVNTRPRNKPGR